MSEKLLKPGVNIVIDAQWGSTGKGKLSALLAEREKVDLLACSFSPNAGHTYVRDDGKTFVNKMVNTAVHVCGSPVLLACDSIVDVGQLKTEMEYFNNRVICDSRAAILLPDVDKERAKETGKHIAGTMQGTGHALSRKILRGHNRMVAGELARPSDYPFFIDDTKKIVRSTIELGGTVLFEYSQGFDLSINHGYEYPFLTSRDITVGAAMNALGLTHKDPINVIGCMRPLPIRVGNIEGGFSGPHYPDQEEITWSSLENNLGFEAGSLVEMTTVTKRVRRVFTPSMMQLKRFAEHNAPDWVFLNFAQHLHSGAHLSKSSAELPDRVHNFINSASKVLGCPIRLVGTGAKQSEYVEL